MDSSQVALVSLLSLKQSSEDEIRFASEDMAKAGSKHSLICGYDNVDKGCTFAEPKVGMKVKVGGKAYRIGMGGGSASSRADGDSRADLDFNAVQRGDAEMEQRMNRVIRACCELGGRNPIVSLHDQGCGGNCSSLKEILDPVGGKIDIRKIVLGDPSMSVLEIWGAEYQESNCALVPEGPADA